jgi:hypothetical protein
MNDNPKPAVGWRLTAVVCLAVVIGLPISRAVAVSLEPTLGPWPAFAVSLAVAAAVGGLVGVASLLLPRPAVKAPPDA